MPYTRIPYTRKSVLTAAAAGAAALAVGVGVGVAVAERPGANQFHDDRYIVKLVDQPVASYQGGVAGLTATSPEDGDKIDHDSPAVTSYRAHLATQREAVLDAAGVEDVVYEYDTVYNGFTADLSADQAADLAAASQVAAVHVDGVSHADTSHTPEFLQLTGQDGAWEEHFGGAEHAGEGVIIGVIDSGFWPENDSFGELDEPRPDQDVIDAKWNGECEEGADSADGNVTCNNKMIGARYYDEGVDMAPGEFASPRDYHGHGAHVAGTAGGNVDVDAGEFGEISGVAPASRLATYKACWRISDSGCGLNHSNGLAAIEDAVNDGVDVINYSISGAQDTAFDDINEAYLHAAAAGVFVASSAGNNGPDAGTVAKGAPWITAVASGTHDRDDDRAPELADSSSAGPSQVADGNILKPDVLAPGVDVRAAWSPASRDGEEFGVMNGTSMASPHVAGVGALLRSAHPDWSPMAVKSAIMTTATDLDNTGEPIQRNGADADPYSYGAGLTQPGAAFDPGLAYVSDVDDWWMFGCGIGEVTGAICDDLGSVDPSDLNYPSVAATAVEGSQTIPRTVTNLSESAQEYTAVLDTPDGLDVAVDQETLSLDPGESATFDVTVTVDGLDGHGFASLTWKSDAGHEVVSRIAVGSA